jgi:hypothetical protein
MPFKSKSQLRKCFAANDPNWDCKKWAHETPNIKGLPDRKGKSELAKRLQKRTTKK